MSLMGIDIGTTGTKAIVFSEEGEQLAGAYVEYDLLFPNPGWVEFDTEVMWQKIFSVIRKVNSDPLVKKDPVSALSVSTIGESFTPIDKQGNILYNTIYSTDARSTVELEYIYSRIPGGILYDITGYPPGYIAPLNKILWIKNNMPDVFKKTHKLLFTPDLLFYRMGVKDTKINYSLCTRTLFFDIREKKWAEDFLDEFGIDPGLFSEPAPSSAIVGYAGKEEAEDLGFKKEVALVAGVHDQPGTAFGVGAVSDGVAANGMGTVDCVTVAMDQAVINRKMLEYNFPTQIHALEDKYTTLAYNMSSGSLLKWYRDVLAYEERNTAKEKNINIYDYLFLNLDFEPSNLMVLPYFSASGTPRLDSVPKGSIIGLSLSTKKEEIFKAMVEGLVFEIAYNIELLESSGVRVSELRAVGGGAKSDYWLKLKASITGKTIKRMDVTEAGCLATMMLAGIGTGIFTTEEAISGFVKVKEIFEPDNKIAQGYMQNFQKYKKIYDNISKIYN